MRVLLAMLLVGVTGCGGGSSSPAQTADADPVAALEKVGAKFKRNGQGEVVEVSLEVTKITDAGLVHLKGMTELQKLNLSRSNITDAGLMHLKGLPNLQNLSLFGTKVTNAGLVHLKGLTELQELNLRDAGVADLQKALPNCKITK